MRKDQRVVIARWLRLRLAHGPVKVVTLRREMEEHGWQRHTVRRVALSLRVRCWKKRGVRHGVWLWALPGLPCWWGRMKDS